MQVDHALHRIVILRLSMYKRVLIILQEYTGLALACKHWKATFSLYT